MSIIQTIRDKAWIIFVAIAVALIAFIVQDGFQGSGMFGQQSTTIGKVNGKKIDFVEFEQRIRNMEANYQANGYTINEQTRQQIRDDIWNSFIEDNVLQKHFEELGLRVTDKELLDILYGENAPQQLRQQFIDSLGNYDAQAAYIAISSLQPGTPPYNSFYGEFVPALKDARMKEKYVAAVANSVYVPKWLIEKNNSNNAQVASIEYVTVPYNSIPDSAVTVTDADIKDYLNKHKDLYKQEKSRSIEYVVFNAAPTSADSAAIFERVESKKEAFATAENISLFLSLENSESPYYDGIINRKEIKIQNFDEIASAGINEIYGPYLDGSHVTLARIIEKKNIPDTVKVRHILIATTQRDPSGNSYPVRTDDDAKRLADSIADAIKKGSSFTDLCTEFSDDQGSVANGGEYDNIVSASMVPEFNDFIFKNPTGTKGVVKTDFGYHYVEILSQKGSSAGYKVAYYNQPIVASEKTVNSARTAAALFAGTSRSYDKFVATAKDQNLNRFTATDIKPMDANIYGIGTSRDLVKWIVRDAKVGDVSESPFLVGDKFIVPVVTADYEEGVIDVKKARPIVEFKVRNNKKAEKIIRDVNGATDLQSIAEATGQLVLVADSVAFNNPFVSNVGQDLKFVGAAFNKNNVNAVSKPIVGEQGVYYVKVNEIKAVTAIQPSVEEQQRSMEQQQKSMIGYRLFDIIGKTATVKDYRYKFY